MCSQDQGLDRQENVEVDEIGLLSSPCAEQSIYANPSPASTTTKGKAPAELGALKPEDIRPGYMNAIVEPVNMMFECTEQMDGTQDFLQNATKSSGSERKS